MALRKFHIGDILSITTHKLLSPRHMDGVYDILRYMVAEDLWTHQLIRVCEECTPYLLEEMPWLQEITGEDVGPQNYQKWLNDKIARYGEYHEVRPIHPEDHEVIDPETELKLIVGDEKPVINIQVDEEEPPSPYGDITWKND